MLKYIKFWQTIVLQQRFSPIYVAYSQSFARSVINKQRKSILRLYIYNTASAAHLMQHLLTACTYTCVATYITCLGNNMCEFSCCNCSLFLFFSIHKNSFSFCLSLFLHWYSKTRFILPTKSVCSRSMLGH